MREPIAIHLCRNVVLLVVMIMATEQARSDYTFGEPQNMGPTVNSSVHDFCPRVSTDGLSLFFPSDRAGGRDIYVATRPTKYDLWGAPVNLGSTVNSSASDYSLDISADGLSLYFVSKRGGGSGNYDLWVTNRPTTRDPWNAPVNLGPTVNSPADDYAMSISTDGRTLTFASNRGGGSGGYDLWITKRPTTKDPWGSPVNLGPTVNSSANEYTLGTSADDRLLFVVSNRSGGYGQLDIWVARRASPDDDYEAPVNLGPMVNSSVVDGFPSISVKGRMLYFSSNRPGGSGGVDLWQASIDPVVDFTGDYKVDTRDLLLLIEHWGQNEPSVDIAPTPFGDGIVDAADLEVLMSHWGKDLDDPHLIAHWKLDEIEGDVAYDSIAENDALALGDPVWQPGAGQVNGALHLDGRNDYIDTLLILNPAEGAFSVFAWISGATPGQVIVSQEDGEDWLLTSAEGNLMTALKGNSGRGSGPLISGTMITDDRWHRVGFAYDGLNRVLSVDGAVVSQDTQPNLPDASGNLQIGTGGSRASDSFWSGTIDDVQLYNRAVEP